jgi:hypothetical protein
MTDSNFHDPEKAHKLHAQKLEAMKTLMNKIVDNPESVKVTDIQKTINFSSNNVTDQ